MKWKLLTLGLVCLIVLSACGGSGTASTSTPQPATPVPATPMPPTSVKIEGVLLTHDDGNGNPGELATTLIFKPSDRSIHAVVKLDTLESNLTVKFSWVAVAAAGSINQTIAGQDVSELTSTTVYGIITMPTDWPTGKYRLEIYLNGNLTQSIDYTVA